MTAAAVCSNWRCSDIAIGVLGAGSAAFTLLIAHDVNCPAQNMLRQEQTVNFVLLPPEHLFVDFFFFIIR